MRDCVTGVKVDDVKRRISILELLPEAFPSGGNGRWYKVRCPFHDDRKASGWIDTREQLFGCHVCGFKPLDVINLYARLNNMSNAQALEALANLT
jgi:DNA primase